MAQNVGNTNFNSEFNAQSDFNFDVEETSTYQGNNDGQINSSTKPDTISPKDKVNPQPQIPRDSAPFIVLCGPPSSGKSMVMKSVASYLYSSKSLGYTITANRTLLNTDEYHSNCDLFDDIIGKRDTYMPNTVNYLMADIMDGRGEVVAHFLEAPGEDFFSIDESSKEPNRPFKGYLERVAQTILGEERKVVYIIILDLDSPTSLRNDPDLRDKYERKMVKLYNRFVLHHASRVILLYNKVDLPLGGMWANSNGCTNPSAIIEDAMRNYPRLFFKKKFLFWNLDDYVFLPYCTGAYEGGYTAAGPAYPSALWKEITKQLW